MSDQTVDVFTAKGSKQPEYVHPLEEIADDDVLDLLAFAAVRAIGEP